MGGGCLWGVVAHGGSTVNLKKVCRDHNPSKAQFIRHTFAKLNCIGFNRSTTEAQHQFIPCDWVERNCERSIKTVALKLVFKMNKFSLTQHKYNVWITTMPESGKQMQKFHTDNMSLPRSENWFWFNKGNFQPLVTTQIWVLINIIMEFLPS